MHRPFPKQLWILPLCMMAGLLLLFPHWTVDDAYISYRYGMNWLETGEWVWNVGEKPIEGFTGYLLPVLAAALHSLNLPIESGLRCIGMLATLGSLLVLGEILRTLRVNEWIAFLALCLVCLQPWVYVHAGSGLETSIFLFIVALQLWSSLRLKLHDGGWVEPLIWCVLSLLLTFVRPEGILLFGASAGVLVWQARSRRLKWVMLSGLVAVPVLVFQYWRFRYFGSVLPNSVLAKGFEGVVNVESMKDFARFLMLYMGIPAFLAFGLYLVEVDTKPLDVEEKALRRRKKRMLAIAAMYCVPAILVYARSHLFMNYAGRFFVPMAPLLFVGTAVVADWGWQRFAQSRIEKPRRWRLARWVFLGMISLQMILLAAKWRSEWAWVNRYAAIMEGEYKPAAQFLKQNLKAGDRLICYMDAGAIPFFTRANVTDFGRLNDRHLVRVSSGSSEAVEYFFAQEARFAVFTSYYPDRYVYLDEAHAIQADPRFEAFQLVKVFAAPGVDDYYQFVFEYQNGQRLGFAPDSANFNRRNGELGL